MGGFVVLARFVSHIVSCVLMAAVLAACASSYPSFTPAIAQPNARPARNFTSFAQALRCMDGLLAQLPKRRYLVSSSDIPDRTRDVDVGADDMLINALNQMNRSSQRYVFLDQARISGFGQLELVTTRKKGEVKPDLYIRGSISQLDEETVENTASFGTDSDRVRGFTNSLYRNNRTLSVVSVDLHLVQYPSRRVLAGGSVSNAMVVSRRGITGTIAGVINAADAIAPITIDRIESRGQAVRNLIELGLIELLGQHSGVPYWTCLGSPSTDAKAAEQRERAFTLSQRDIMQIQTQLIALGHLKGTASGTLDAATRAALSEFQARHNLLANGTPDFDTVERLNGVYAARPKPAAPPAAPPPGSSKTSPPQAQSPAQAQGATRPTAAPSAKAPTSKPAVAPATSPQCTGGQPCVGIYKNLYDFIKEDMAF